MTFQATYRAVLAGSAILAVPAAAAAQEATSTGDQRTAQNPTPLANPTPADAPAADSALGDIVVTAQKRASSVQDTPLAITAVGGADLRAREINSLENLAPQLPNVNFGKNVGFARIAIRGVGLDTTVVGQEGRVAYHTDGIYISRPTAAIATFFDVNRVEVVRGPQGTLYGRNATAGAINVITNDPEQKFGGYAKLTVGNYGMVGYDGAVTGALTDTISARFAVQTVDRGGYGHISRWIRTSTTNILTRFFAARSSSSPTRPSTSCCRPIIATKRITRSSITISAWVVPACFRSARCSAAPFPPIRAIRVRTCRSMISAASMASARSLISLGYSFRAGS